MNSNGTPTRGATILILACLFISGTAALIYEVTWIRRAALVFGSTTFALSTILAVFFLGLGLGGYIFGRMSLRSRRPLVVFAVLEILIAAMAALSPLAFELVDGIYGQFYSFAEEQAALSIAIRFLLVSAVLFPPTVLMGASLPLFCRYFLEAEPRFGRSIGLLYALNTLGGAVGAAAAGFWMLPKFGLNATLYTAALLDVLAGVAVYFLRTKEVSQHDTEDESQGAGQSTRGGPIYALLFSVSFVALGVEVLWARHLSLLFRNSVYTYTLTLTVVLVGIVIGSFAVSPRLDGLMSRTRVFGWLQFLTGLSILVLMGLAPSTWRGVGPELTTCFLLFLPTAIFSGASFPLAIRMVVRTAALGSHGTGKMVAVSSVGGVVGSTLVGLYLLPNIGLERSLFGIAGVSLFSAAVTWLWLEAEKPILKRLASAGLCAGVLVLAPFASETELPADFLAEGADLIDFHEGYGSNLSVVRVDDDEIRLEIDRWWQGTNRKNHQIFAAHLPMLLHPDPRQVLVVGAGTGQTASRFLLYDIEQLECVDIEPTIFEFINEHFDSEWMDDPRAVTVREDGRAHVRHGESTYDVISIEVGQVFRPGVAYFYTSDFYAEARAKLNESGLLVQFVPLAFLTEEQFRGIVRSFTEVFGECALWYNTGELLLVGTNSDRFKIDASTLDRLALEGPVHDDLEYAHWGDRAGWLNNRRVFLSGYLLGSKELAAVASTGRIYRDDLPVLDYATQTVDKFGSNEIPLVNLIEGQLASLSDALGFELSEKEARDVERIRLMNLGQIEASALVRQAEALRAKNDHVGAVAILERAVKCNDRHFASQLLLGDSLMFRGEAGSAQAHFEAASKIRPESARAHYGLAVTLFQEQRLGEAAASFKHAIELRPDDAAAHNGMGAVLDRLGDRSGARYHFEEAVRLKPNSTEYRTNLERIKR